MWSHWQVPALLLVLGCSPPTPATDAGASDMPADAAVDADLRPAHCSPASAPPSWVEVVAPYQLIAHCSDVNLGVTLFADGIVRMRYQPGADSGGERSWAVLTPLAPAEVIISEQPGAVELCSDQVKIVVTAACQVDVTDASGATLVDDAVEDGGWSTDDSGATVRHSTPPDERFYGFGEKNGPLDKRGQKLTFWNTDAYEAALGGYPVDHDPLYLSIPFFIGLRDQRAYGLFTDNSFRLEMDMAAARSDTYAITAAGGVIDQYLITGPAIADVVRRFTALSGRPPLPPRWSLGFHQSRWGYSPAAQVEEIAARLRSESMPADGLWLDIQHLDGFRTFTWEPTTFADPGALLANLAALGFKLTVIADPGIKIDPGWEVYDSGVQGQHFLRTGDGELYEGFVWPGPAVFPDLTCAATRGWWGEWISSYTDLGVRGIWLDVNEPTNFPEAGGSTIPDDVPVCGEGTATTMAEAHNVYALQEAAATYAGMEAANPSRRPFILSRAGYAGIQRYAAVWTGDATSTWPSLRTTLPMLLNMGLSGLSFVGSDVGGYSGNASAELYARWMALGSISPFFRAHVTDGVPGQEPWQFGTEVRDISRALIGERYRLLPYWYSLFAAATASGAPALRPLVYDFQDDDAAATIADQAMIGPFIMAAPIVAEAATSRTIYLPPGRWFELHSGAIFAGPTTIEVAVTLAALPLYVRAGAIIPRGQLMQFSDQVAIDPLHLDLYPADRSTSFDLYEDAGDGFDHRDGEYSRVTYALSGRADGAELVVGARAGDWLPAARRLELRLRRVDNPPTSVTRDQLPLPAHASYAMLVASGEGWWYDPDDRSIVVLMSDSDAFTLRWFYDPAISELRPAVAVAVAVSPPAGTPTDVPIHIATSASAWSQQPLTWGDDGIARGTVTVPRGEWFFYKYTRGDWDTVEKWPDCAEANDRYRFGAAAIDQVDTIYGWRDWCP